MNATQFKELVDSLTVGKHLPDAIYLHKDAFSALPTLLAKFIKVIAQALKVPETEWNVVKLGRKEFRLSLLDYPSFYSDSYPSLRQSVSVDLSKLQQRVTRYDAHDNPPILHRKEHFILPEHPEYANFCMITQEGEAAGLYENARMIGFKENWLRVIAKHGYELIDGRLFRSSAVRKITEESNIDRHKTALVRHELSAPMKSIAKHGFLDGSNTIFDYGCGRGDDLRELEAHGLEVLGWDPNFRPDTEKLKSDVVNLGFVINVIEDKVERLEALLGAWDLTQKLLVVSAMLGNESYIAQFQPYKDGVITSRNTFQKYYSQSELKEFIETSLDENAIAISPGIFFVFRDKCLEQEFQQNRQKRHYEWKHLTAPEPVSETQARLLFTQHEALFEAFWKRCLELGRLPAEDEFDEYKQLTELVGSPKKVLKLLSGWYDISEFEKAAEMRKEDLLVYFALAQFQKHKGYSQQPELLKRDIKAFFGNYNVSILQAKELLFSIANTEVIEQACVAIADKVNGKLVYEDELVHSLIIDKANLNGLPAILRVYVGSALQLYGDIDEVNEIKIHVTSAKLTLMSYIQWDFAEKRLLKQRIKIDMSKQKIDIYNY